MNEVIQFSILVYLSMHMLLELNVMTVVISRSLLVLHKSVHQQQSTFHMWNVFRVRSQPHDASLARLSAITPLESHREFTSMSAKSV